MLMLMISIVIPVIWRRSLKKSLVLISVNSLLSFFDRVARFSNYEAWLSDPTHIGPSAQVVWPIVGQEILNGDVGGGL
jgi:hypothetical protein